MDKAEERHDAAGHMDHSEEHFGEPGLWIGMLVR